MTPSDQKFYDMVADELRAKMIADGVWVRSVAESRGDEAKARAIYIGYRVNQLKAEAEMNIARDAYYAGIRTNERAKQERERRDRHIRALDAARSHSLDVVKIGERIFFGLFILTWLVVIANQIFSFSPRIQLAEIVLVFSATGATLLSLACQLPGQNVLLASAIIAITGTFVYWIGAITGPTSRVAGYSYDNVPGSRDFNENPYSSGPSNPFGAASVDERQISLYANYSTVPTNTARSSERLLRAWNSPSESGLSASTR